MLPFLLTVIRMAVMSLTFGERLSLSVRGSQKRHQLNEAEEHEQLMMSKEVLQSSDDKTQPCLDDDDESMQEAEVANFSKASTIVLPPGPDQKAAFDKKAKQDAFLETVAAIPDQVMDHPRDHYPSELQGLVDALQQEYANERQFSMALFNALQSGLLDSHHHHRLIEEECSPMLKPENQCIIFKYGQTDTHAMGIQREVNGDRNSASIQNKQSARSVKTKETSSRLNHCPCLLERITDDSKWNLVDCFSQMELTMDDTNCCDVFDSRLPIRQQIQLDGRHGSAAQAMLYTLRWVLPGLARIGQRGTEIPWAVIVGKRLRSVKATKQVTMETERSVSNRWMSGNIYVPEECGAPFSYAVTGYGGRMNEVATVDLVLDSVLDALVVYLKTILFGLKAAKACLDFHHASGCSRWPDPCSVSGKQVVICGYAIPSQLRATATSKFRNRDNSADRHWDCAQGELFTGKLNLARLYKTLPKGKKDDFIIFDKIMAEADRSVEADVVIKVSSRAVHNSLTNPDKNLDALKSLALDSDSAPAISKVLYAVNKKKPLGVVTIMADLSLQKYQVLRPQTCGILTADLWNAFEVVVQDVFVPMADLEKVHVDIRPGWDVTSNILCRVVDEQGGDKSATMQVIDYESVISLHDWILPIDDHRYIERCSGWNAFTYLWWQCANLAHAWHGTIHQEHMIAIDLRSLVKDGSWRQQWFRGVDVPEDVELTNEGFQKHFATLRNLFSYEPPVLPMPTVTETVIIKVDRNGNAGDQTGW